MSDLDRDFAEDKPKTLAKVREIVLSWFEVDEDWGNQETFFFAYFPTLVEDVEVKRPCYLFFAPGVLFIDAPFSKVSEFDILTAFQEDTPIPWGLGRMQGAYTFHNVISFDLILSNPDAFQMLLGMIISQAGYKELEITGKIHFKR